jgi:hypothetical protein
MALKSTSDHCGTVAVSIHWSSRSDSNPHRLGLRCCQRRGPCSESGNSAGPRADRSRGAGIDDPSDRLVVGLRSETYSGCRIATLAGAYRPGGACPFLHYHPGNDCERPRNVGAERRSATHLWWRRRAAAGFLEVSAPATALHRSAASAYLGRPSRWCRSSSSFRSPRRSALAHVVQ